jgi:hypothetical protein
MAFYPYNAAHPAPQPFGLVTDQAKEPVRVDGVGAYYAYDATHEAVQPINGLAGAMGPAAELADEAVRAIIGPRQPIMVGVEWATAVTDAAWRPSAPKHELALVGMTEAELSRVKQAAFGHALPVVGILAARPVPLERARAAFRGSPYAFHELVAIAPMTDSKCPPPLTPFFLYFGSERDPDDDEGGAKLMGQVAGELGGKIVHAIALPLERPVPRLPPIDSVLAALGRRQAPRPQQARATGAIVHPGMVSIGPRYTPLGLLGDSGLVLLAGLAVAGIGYALRDKL